MQESNGQNYMQYGPGEGHIILLSWVQIMLEDLYKENPDLFGRLVHRAALSGRADANPPAIKSVQRVRGPNKPAPSAPRGS